MATTAENLSTSVFLPEQRVTATVEKLNVPCRFYRIGSCRFGENCRYLHLENDSVPPQLSNPTNNGDKGNLPSSSSNQISSTFSVSDPNKWVLAPVFVPNQHQYVYLNLNSPVEDNPPILSYADVVNNTNPKPPTEQIEWNPSGQEAVLCPYLMKSGICRYETCVYDHGLLCDLCGKFCLDPLDGEKRKQHHTECIAQHEREMETAFAVQRSKEKSCGICFDVVWEKDGREQRFGILPNCNHCFCLECIRTWRQAKQFDNKIIRSCPECRTCSDFVCPSSFWVDNSEEKEKLISKYKKALSDKDCKYFKKGTGRCPFGNKCFYKHTLANGDKIDVGEPQRPIRQLNSLGDRLQSLLFWDFIEERYLNEDIYISSDEESDLTSDFLDVY